MASKNAIDKNSVIILIAVGVSFVLLIAATSFFSGAPTKKSSAGSRTPVKKLRAAPGKERKNARAIVSSTPSASRLDDPGHVPTTRDGKPLEAWGDHSRPTADTVAELSDEEALANEALEAMSTEEGIEEIEAALQTLENASQITVLYTAVGTRPARNNPSSLAKANAAFEKAIVLAVTDDQRIDAVYHQAKALMRSEKHESTIEVIEEELSRPLFPSKRRVELGVVQGLTYEKLGRRVRAEHAYRKVIEEVVQLGRETDPAIINVYRQAVLRLSRLYRQMDRPKEADQVVRSMKTWLGE